MQARVITSNWGNVSEHIAVPSNHLAAILDAIQRLDADMLSLSETHVVSGAYEIVESAFELIGWKCIMTTGPDSHDGV
eukprot:5012578-Prymnesium_polylepis.1